MIARKKQPKASLKKVFTARRQSSALASRGNLVERAMSIIEEARSSVLRTANRGYETEAHSKEEEEVTSGQQLVGRFCPSLVQNPVRPKEPGS